MARTKEQAEQSSFPLARDERTANKLLEAGKYDWVADYARQIVDSTSHSTGEQTEIILLDPPHSWIKEDWLLLYDLPEVRDVLRFGADYPDEPWLGPEREPFQIAGTGSIVHFQCQLFVLVLRADGPARGFSYTAYTSSLTDWGRSARIAVRKRPDAAKVPDAEARTERPETPDAPW